jgi:hypothetical protein
MSRYPSEQVARCDQQFAETRAERKERMQKARAKACQHELSDLFKKEGQWMPHPFTKGRGAVWCDECKAWISFEFNPETKP